MLAQTVSITGLKTKYNKTYYDQYSKSIQLLLRPSTGLMIISPLANQSYCPEANIKSF